MAAKLSVWEAGLWKNFQESENLVVFASEQWRLLAPEVRKNATKMGVTVTSQEKSHWIHGMLLMKNKEAAKAKEKEIAANLLAAFAPPSSYRASFPRQKENIIVAHADIGLGKLLNLMSNSSTQRILAPRFESPRSATRTTHSTLRKSLGCPHTSTNKT